MLIEALVRWTELDYKRDDSDEAYAKRIISGEETGPMSAPKFVFDFSPMVFDLNDIVRFNRAHDPNYTTLRFKDGDGFVIKYPYKEFLALWIELTGKNIQCILPEDFENNTKKTDDLLDGI